MPKKTKNSSSSTLASLKKELKRHRFFYSFLAVTLIVALLLRIYRIDQLLGFYFDQGRDALVIWDLWHKGEIFLIGPTTGLAGIFRGPYYYYLIAPFYLLGGGNPIWPSAFLSLTTILAIALGAILAFKIQNKASGIIFATIASFSFYIVIASRWLSNPTPMLLLSMILVWAMVKVNEGKKWAWPIIAFVSGLSLFNFGSSGELFYFPALIIFAIWIIYKQGFGKKSSLDIKIVIVSITLFFATFAPLVIFNLKHDNILLNNFQQTFGKEQSFTKPTEFLFEVRNEFYGNLLPKIIFHSRAKVENAALITILGFFLLFLPSFIKNKNMRLLLLLMISPLLGLYFYQGNETILYEYYLTGYYLIFILLAAITLGKLWEYKLGKVFVLFFIFLFLKNNREPLDFILKNKSDGPESIAFINQKQALEWIYADASGKPFSTDIYVPPVIPHAYNYLFLWYGGEVKGYQPSSDQIDPLYTIYEVDPPNPDRLEAWLKRQVGIGTVEEEAKFGGVTVQRRKRI